MADVINSFIVKFVIDDNTRRMTLPRAVLSSMDSLSRLLYDVHGEFSGKPLSITWTDKDGGIINIRSDHELCDAIDTQSAGGRSTLRFSVAVNTQASPHTDDAHPAISNTNLKQNSEPYNWAICNNRTQNAVVHPGEEFTKTWRVRNKGQSAWPPGCTLKFRGPDGGFAIVNARGVVPLPELAPGEEAHISIRLRAPAEARDPITLKFRATTNYNKRFSPTALLNVAVLREPPPATKKLANYPNEEVADDAAVGSATLGESLEQRVSTHEIAGGQSTQSFAVAQNNQVSLQEETIRHKNDDADSDTSLKQTSSQPYCWGICGNERQQTVVFSSQEFIQTLRVCNRGKSAWPRGCTFELKGNLKKRFGFELINECDALLLPELAPGEEADISVSLRAPGQVLDSATVSLKFRAKTKDNKKFQKPIQLKVAVLVPTKPLPTAGSSFSQAPPSTPPLIGDQTLSQKLEASSDTENRDRNYSVDPNIPELTCESLTFHDNAVVLSRQEFKKTWCFRNTGESKWPPGCVLKSPNRHLSGFEISEQGRSIPLPELAPGEENMHLCRPSSSKISRSCVAEILRSNKGAENFRTTSNTQSFCAVEERFYSSVPINPDR